MEQSASLAFCPYLRSRQDRTTAYAYPTIANRCYAPAGPKKLSPDYQASYCLGPAHDQCPFFISQEQAYLKFVNDSARFSSRTQSILTLLEYWSKSLRLKGASGLRMPVDWGARVAGAAGQFPALFHDWSAPSGRGVQSVRSRPRRTLVLGLGLIILLLLGFATLPRLAGSELLRAGTPVAAPNLALVEGPGLTPSLDQAGATSATPSLTERPPTRPVVVAREVAAGTATPQPAMTPLPTPTATPSATPSRAVTATRPSIKKPSPTPSPQPSDTPTSSPLYSAPLLLDPPDGYQFKRNTILRWSSDHVLNQDELFDVLVWPAKTAQPASIGSTTEPIFSIDFKSWPYAGGAGTFYWTIRIKSGDGTYLSPASQPLSFIVE
jgi:hypothetical protein